MIHGFTKIIVPILIVLSGFICLEFALPISVGEFLAGMLGSIFFDFEKIPWLEFFSYLGILCIMFLAGFEIDTRILKMNFRKNLIVGFCSFFLPYILIVLLAIMIGISYTQALILGTALSTTSLAIVFTILRTSEYLETKNGQILLGSAMIVDIISMINLTIILVGFSFYNLIYLIVLALILIWIRKVVITIFRRYQGNKAEFELKFFMLILLFLGLLSEGAGIHAAIIAFLTGVIFSNIDQEYEDIILKLHTIVFSLLAPIFFFHAGTLLSITSIDLQSLLWLVLFLFIAVSGKYFATFMAIYFLHGKDFKLARYGGVLFNYRLSFGIVIGVYAYETNIIDINVLNIILLIVGISSVLAVILEKNMKFNFK
ncbi:MAG: cation:proton antiporter [Pseudomonadota bacterium]